jgi:hypothetical protein
LHGRTCPAQGPSATAVTSGLALDHRAVQAKPTGAGAGDEEQGQGNAGLGASVMRARCWNCVVRRRVLSSVDW